MKERPILMGAPMVRAILAGRKTKTRRLVKDAHGEIIPPDRNVVAGTYPSGSPAWFADWRHGHGPQRAVEPPGQVGDRLWVKETWATEKDLDTVKPSHLDETDTVFYLADGTRRGDPATQGKTRVSIFMPRWMSRLTLEVTSVRVERANAISVEDARAEGFSSDPVPGRVNGKPATVCFFDPLQWFAALWDGLNGDRAPWKSAPWVWVVGFRVVPK